MEEQRMQLMMHPMFNFPIRSKEGLSNSAVCTANDCKFFGEILLVARDGPDGSDLVWPDNTQISASHRPMSRKPRNWVR